MKSSYRGGPEIAEHLRDQTRIAHDHRRMNDRTSKLCFNGPRIEDLFPVPAVPSSQSQSPGNYTPPSSPSSTPGLASTRFTSGRQVSPIMHFGWTMICGCSDAGWPGKQGRTPSP